VLAGVSSCKVSARLKLISRDRLLLELIQLIIRLYCFASVFTVNRSILNIYFQALVGKSLREMHGPSRSSFAAGVWGSFDSRCPR
jgi:hypothetical protein